MNLSPLPVQKFFDSNGAPLVNGLLFTYAAGTATKIATYKDQAGTTNTNPIQLDYRGEANVWLDQTLVYKFVLAPAGDTDPPTKPIWTVDNISAALTYVSLTQQIVGQILFPRTAAEIAAGVTPTFYYYLPGDIRRYGAVLDGVTDDTTAVTNWAKVGGSLTWPVVKTANITATIPLVSNTTIQFAEGGGVTTATHDISFFKASSKTNVTVRGGTFTQTSIAALGYIAGLHFDGCTYCTAENNEFIGMQWSGVFINASSYCTARGNYIHASLGTIQDANDISVLSSATTPSSYNVVDGNFCFGGGEHGILVQDPYSTVLSVKNIVSNNRIGAHNGYGIICYMPDAGDSYNQIIGNDIQDISAYSGNNSSGTGIYIVGAGCGGTVVIGNIIRNCCITTANRSQAPAGIGLSNLGANSAPVLISGNTVTDMTKYDGILVTSSLGPVTISGNTIRQPSGNTTGYPISVDGSSNVVVSGNVVNQFNVTTGRGIFINANGVNASNNVVIGNTVQGGNFSLIETNQVGGFTCVNTVINGNTCTGSGAGGVPIFLNSMVGGSVTGNAASANTQVALSFSNCTQVRVANNVLLSTGGSSVSSSGTCTGSFFDQSNYFNGNIANIATGLITERRAAAQPAAGTAAVGDTWWQTTPVSGAAPGGMCTTAGSPGTWKNFGNLA